MITTRSTKPAQAAGADGGLADGRKPFDASAHPYHTTRRRSAQIYSAAERLHAAGLCVIPLGEGSKRPALATWKLLQSRRPDASERYEWFTDHSERNLGVVCGKVSGNGADKSLVVLDFDEPSAFEAFAADHPEIINSTWVARTGRGGTHVYLFTQGDVQTTKITGGDLKGEGGYVVAPPSIHPNGQPYTWIRREGTILEVENLNALGIETKAETKRPTAAVVGRIKTGERNSTLTSLAGTMRLRGMTEAEILAALLVINEERCGPPLEEDEVRRIARSIARYEPAPQAKERESAENTRLMKDVILDLALGRDITLFTNQHGVPYCRTPRGNHYEVLSVDGSDFRDWLGWLLYQHDGRTCSDKTLEPARRMLRAMAKFEGPTHRLHNRTAWGDDGALYYDLSDNRWRAVRVAPVGWTVEQTPPILFRRYRHQAPQVAPSRVALAEAPGVLRRVFDFVNLRDEDNRLLFTVHLVSLLVPRIAHPIPVLHGEQGSGKTFALKMLRQLVDPSNVSTLAIPWKSDEFVQQLDHHWCAFYDNLGSLTAWQQDVICRAVTGEGHTKRKLYTDDEDVVYTYRRCIALNGINLVTTRPDLLDRSIIWELDTLEDRRRTEAELQADFDKLKPRLLGAMLEILSGALAISVEDAMRKGRLFRLADWAAMGWRIATAMGGRGGAFLEVYAEAVETKALTSLDLHPLGKTVLAFMSARREWTGTAKELLDELTEVANAEGIDTRSNLWPGSASWVGRRLKEVKPDLRTASITYAYDRASSGGTRREYHLRRM